MNSCVLMAQIIQDPELRYTSDNQTPIAQMLVQFPSMRSDDPPATLKVVGWGNLAQEIKENYRVGDRVVLEGRLSMNTIERPEGFKEKRAELTTYRVHKLGANTDMGLPTTTVSPTMQATIPSSPQSNENVVPMRSRPAPPKPAPVSAPRDQGYDYSSPIDQPSYEPSPVPNVPPVPDTQKDLDDIPF